MIRLLRCVELPPHTLTTGTCRVGMSACILSMGRTVRRPESVGRLRPSHGLRLRVHVLRRLEWIVDLLCRPDLKSRFNEPLRDIKRLVVATI